MPARGGGAGCTEQEHPPENEQRGHGDDAPSHSPPPQFPVIVSEKKKQRRDQQRTASLPDDILIEILLRVPYRSLCSCKSVCKPWLALWSDLDIYNRSPQALSGFFFDPEFCGSFTFHDLDVGGHPLVDPTLSFLGSYERIIVEECSSGALLLCKCWESLSYEGKYSYVVCNPATEKWTVLPRIENADRVDGPPLFEDRPFDINEAEHFLGFDTANPSVFVVVVPETFSSGQVREVAIYSSETGRWAVMENQWSSETTLVECFEAAPFVNGRMHFTACHAVVTVDIQGETWGQIKLPKVHGLRSIRQSQGYLHYWNLDKDSQLSVRVLEDYGSGVWTLKHTVNGMELFGRRCRIYDDECYEMVELHPDCNLLFLTSEEMTVSYDMDTRKVRVICPSKRLLASVPYIPCFAKWPSVRRIVPVAPS